jgi:hypothetical protein
MKISIQSLLEGARGRSTAATTSRRLRHPQGTGFRDGRFRRSLAGISPARGVEDVYAIACREGRVSYMAIPNSTVGF